MPKKKDFFISGKDNGIKKKAERMVFLLRILMVLNFLMTLAILVILIVVIYYTKQTYDEVVAEITPDNLRSAAESIFPKNYLKDYFGSIVNDIINDYLMSNLQVTGNEHISGYMTQADLENVMREKCRQLDYCYNSRNTSACLSFVISTENWCKVHYL